MTTKPIAKMREIHFWTRRTPNGSAVTYDMARCTPYLFTQEGEWHFVELPPGARVITEAELERVLIKNRGFGEHEILRELFGKDDHDTK